MHKLHVSNGPMHHIKSVHHGHGTPVKVGDHTTVKPPPMRHMSTQLPVPGAVMAQPVAPPDTVQPQPEDVGPEQAALSQPPEVV